MDRPLRISDIVLPDKARSAKKLQSLAGNALSIGADVPAEQRTYGDVIADKVLLYGILGIVARLEAASEQDSGLRKALEEIFPESTEGP
jgi:hypothetical protein